MLGGGKCHGETPSRGGGQERLGGWSYGSKSRHPGGRCMGSSMRERRLGATWTARGMACAKALG